MKSSSGYEIYHNTLSSVLDEIERYVQSKGYEVGDYFPEINHVSYGTTERTQLEMLKNGRIANTLAIQVYRLDSGKYELNCYPVRKFAKGDLIAKTMHEFKRGQLHSSSGDVVRNPKQAIAIGLSKERRGKFATGGMVLWGTKVGEPDYKEQLITENENQIEAAKKWAEQNGFDRLRIQNLDLSTPPDFKKTFGKGGGIKSIKIGDKFHYKFDGKDYEVLGIENSKIVISPISSNSYWNNREISFSLMNKWIIEKTMRKI